jgi:hypothetical protein
MANDARLYLNEPGWKPAFHTSDEKLLCHLQRPEDGYYHRISRSELYLARDTEVYCLTCAVHKGLLTKERPSLEKSERWDRSFESE